MSRKRKLEESDETESEANQVSASGDPHVVRYKIKRTRIEEAESRPAPVEAPASEKPTVITSPPTHETEEKASAQCGDQSNVKSSGEAATVASGEGPGAPAVAGKGPEPGEGEDKLRTSTKEDPVGLPTKSDDTSSEQERPRNGSDEHAAVSQSQASVSEEKNAEEGSEKKAQEEKPSPGQTGVEAQSTPLTADKPSATASAGSSPKVPLFNPETLLPQANILRTPFSSRRREEGEDLQAIEKNEADTTASGNDNNHQSEKLETFPQLSDATDSPAKVASPSGTRPQSFPGEEKEEAVFSDYNAILLKCVNTSNQEEKPIFKYRQVGTGVIRILKERDGTSCRVVFRQTGTWQVYLNSPLDLVGRVESTDLSTNFGVKFTAFDAIASTQEKPKLAPFCVKLTDSTNRKRLVSLLTQAE